jgi:hypothetical protein
LEKPENRRRTIYGEVKRRELAGLLRLHDFPDPVAHSAARDATTTPLQQLFTLNSPLLAHQSDKLAERMHSEVAESDNDRIAWLYHTVFGRAASADELAAAVEFLSAAAREKTSVDEVWRQYCHVLLASNELLFVE